MSVRTIKERCEANELVFDNDDVSLLLTALEAAKRALVKIAALADTGSDQHKQFAEPYHRMGDKPSGWRVAEEMRSVAVDAIGDDSR